MNFLAVMSSLFYVILLTHTFIAWFEPESAQLTLLNLIVFIRFNYFRNLRGDFFRVQRCFMNNHYYVCNFRKTHLTT
jgi:hypothetical protein